MKFKVEKPDKQGNVIINTDLDGLAAVYASMRCLEMVLNTKDAGLILAIMSFMNSSKEVSQEDLEKRMKEWS